MVCPSFPVGLSDWSLFGTKMSPIPGLSALFLSFLGPLSEASQFFWRGPIASLREEPLAFHRISFGAFARFISLVPKQNSSQFPCSERSFHCSFLPFDTLQRIVLLGSIIVRHIKSILEPSLPLRVYGPMRSTPNASQGVVMTSFGGTCPFFWLCLLFTWQDLQDLMYDRMVHRIPFQYITDLIISSRRECPGCWR